MKVHSAPQPVPAPASWPQLDAKAMEYQPSSLQGQWQRLRQAVKDGRITYPVVADNEYAIWNAFGNQYWPAHYIFDARGQLRYTAFGEGDYARQEQVIQQLLQESKA